MYFTTQQVEEIFVMGVHVHKQTLCLMDIYNLTIIPMKNNHSQCEDVQSCVTGEFAVRSHTVRYWHMEVLEIVLDNTRVFVALFSCSRCHRHVANPLWRKTVRRAQSLTNGTWAYDDVNLLHLHECVNTENLSTLTRPCNIKKLICRTHATIAIQASL